MSVIKKQITVIIHRHIGLHIKKTSRDFRFCRMSRPDPYITLQGKAMKQLESIDLLKETTGQKRNMGYVAEKILKILEE